MSYRDSNCADVRAIAEFENSVIPILPEFFIEFRNRRNPHLPLIARLIWGQHP